MKKKQFYEKPSTKVFELKQQTHLLAGSEPKSDLTQMGEPEDL